MTLPEAGKPPQAGRGRGIPAEHCLAETPGHQSELDLACAWTPHLYRELRALARSQRLRQGGSGSGTTSIVHQAWLRLHDSKVITIENRGRFFALAAKIMRSALIDNARRRGTLCRGGDRTRIELDQVNLESATLDEEILALDESLHHLEAVDARLAGVVTCRFFGGLSIAETAEALDCSPATIKRDWRLARNWLYHDLNR